MKTVNEIMEKRICELRKQGTVESAIAQLQRAGFVESQNYSNNFEIKDKKLGITVTVESKNEKNTVTVRADYKNYRGDWANGEDNEVGYSISIYEFSIITILNTVEDVSAKCEYIYE